jgi:hypothetical protein
VINPKFGVVKGCSGVVFGARLIHDVKLGHVDREGLGGALLEAWSTRTGRSCLIETVSSRRCFNAHEKQKDQARHGVQGRV